MNANAQFVEMVIKIQNTGISIEKALKQWANQKLNVEQLNNEDKMMFLEWAEHHW